MTRHILLGSFSTADFFLPFSPPTFILYLNSKVNDNVLETDMATFAAASMSFQLGGDLNHFKLKTLILKRLLNTGKGTNTQIGLQSDLTKVFKYSFSN